MRASVRPQTQVQTWELSCCKISTVASALVRQLLANSVRVGDFVVGQERTSWFLDASKTICDPYGMLLVADSLLSAIPDDVDSIGGPSATANPIIFSTVAVAATRGRKLRAFTVDRTAVASGHISGALERGDRVVLTDSVVFHGGQLRQAAQLVRAAGAEPVLLAVLFDGSGTWGTVASEEQIRHLALVSAPDLGLPYAEV